MSASVRDLGLGQSAWVRVGPRGSAWVRVGPRGSAWVCVGPCQCSRQCGIWVRVARRGSFRVDPHGSVRGGLRGSTAGSAWVRMGPHRSTWVRVGAGRVGPRQCCTSARTGSMVQAAPWAGAVAFYCATVASVHNFTINMNSRHLLWSSICTTHIHMHQNDILCHTLRTDADPRGEVFGPRYDSNILTIVTGHIKLYLIYICIYMYND